MRISDIIPWVRTFVRNGNDSARYPGDAIHRAVQSVCVGFMAETNWLTTTTLTLSAGSPTLPSTASLTGFAPDRIRRARIILSYPSTAPTNANDPRVDVTDFDHLNNLLANAPQTGMPCLMACNADGSMVVYPTPDQPYSLQIAWAQPLTSWTPGSPLVLPVISGGGVASYKVNYAGVTAYSPAPTVLISGGGGTGATANATLTSQTLLAVTQTAAGTGYTSVPSISLNGVDCTDYTLNLPDDVLQGGILTDGVRSVLQATEPENAGIIALSQKTYQLFIERMKMRAAGTLGEQVSYRKPIPARGASPRRAISGWYRG